MGVVPDLGVAAHYAAIFSTPFRSRSGHLFLGSGSYHRTGGVDGHFCRCIPLCQRRCDCGNFLRLSVSNPPIRSPIKDPVAGEAIHDTFSCLVGTLVREKDHLAHTPYRIFDRTRPPGDSPRTFTQDLPRWDECLYRQCCQRRFSQAVSHDTFGSRILEAGTTLQLLDSEGYCRLRRVLVVRIDFSAATAVAAVFSEIQWSSHHCSTTALIRLRDTYMECFRAPELDKSARLKALQSAAAYYVLYHTRLIWSTSTTFEVEVEKLPSALPPDLLLCLHSDKWDRDDVFEYLLRIEDRSEPVTSARFLSYIAPYWFCGNSDSAIKFRPTRLPILNELIKVLEQFGALNTATITDCVLCVGAVMDFPLHPEDLIRVDKRYVLLLSYVRSGIDWG